MSYYHGRICKGSASCSRPKKEPGHHGAVLYDQPPLLPLPFLFHSTSRTADADEDISSLLSAICFRTLVSRCSSGHCGAVLHVPHNSIRPSASDIRDDGMASLVSSASAIPPFYVHGRCERIGNTPPYGNIKRSVSAPFLFCHLNHSRCKLKSQ